MPVHVPAFSPGASQHFFVIPGILLKLVINPEMLGYAYGEKERTEKSMIKSSRFSGFSENEQFLPLFSVFLSFDNNVKYGSLTRTSFAVLLIIRVYY